MRRLPLGHPNRQTVRCEGCGKRQPKRLSAPREECNGCGFLLCATCKGPSQLVCVWCTARCAGRGKQKAAPIIQECSSCGGTGRVQAYCDNCHCQITEANESEDPDWCQPCLEEEERRTA